MNSNKYDYILVEEMTKDKKYFPIEMIKNEAEKIHDKWRGKFKRILKKGFKLYDESIEIPTHSLSVDEKELIENYTQIKKTTDGFEVYYLQPAFVKYHNQVTNEAYEQLTAEQQHINDRLAYYKLLDTDTVKNCANDNNIKNCSSNIAKNEYLQAMSNI